MIELLTLIEILQIFTIYIFFVVGKAPAAVRSPPVNLSRINQSGKGDSKVIDELNLQVSRDRYYHPWNQPEVMLHLKTSIVSKFYQ